MLSFSLLRHVYPTAKRLLVCSAVFLVPVLAGPEIRAQESREAHNPVADSIKKVIHEPVHRVPKVANNMNAIPNVASVREQLPTDPAQKEQPESRPQDNAPEADVQEKRAGTPAILPSAAKTVSDTVDGNLAIPNVAPGIPASPASTIKPVPHPLDDALETAKRGLEHIRENVRDYSAIMVKRERVNGKLLDAEYLQLKVRSERVGDNGRKIPFSVYMKFIKPRANAGREVIWIKGQNKNQICVHEGSGFVSLKRFNLDPESWLAMKGQRYPIYEAGMENLVVKLIEKAERDRAAGFCEVDYRDGVKVNGRECTVIEVTHPEECAPYDFHIAKVYIDKELKMPIRYQAHIWPKPGSTKPQLLEEYTYLNVKVNQGFTDIDFSPDNPKYKYPSR